MVDVEIPASVPRAANAERFFVDPFKFLIRARTAHGDLFSIHEQGPIFSREAKCVVAALGEAHQRAVLSDMETFAMPLSAAQHLRLSPKLINLNRGLHSMRGETHAAQKRLLMGVLNGQSIERRQRALWTAMENLTEDWSVGRTFGLLATMRSLALGLSTRILFGTSWASSSQLTDLLSTYFRFRRVLTSSRRAIVEKEMEQLELLGNSLDLALRSYARRCRRKRSISNGGVLGALAALQLDEDEIVGHCNVLFMSATEPIAVTLTWILLVLTQLPDLRNELRTELHDVVGSGFATAERLERLTRLDHTIKEVLRLLPPNAFMVRVTTQPTSLSGMELPAHCEVILCPFVAHRDGRHFPKPNKFLPDRWKDMLASPFEFFPFGGGGHYCIGKPLAISVIKNVLAFLLPRYELTLAGDQFIDWRLNIVFMPRQDPRVRIRRPGASFRWPTGKLHGPLESMIVAGGKKS